VLFEHKKHDKNQSDNVKEWARSTHEMLRIIREEKIFSQEDEEKLICSREKHIEQAVGRINDIKLESLFYKGLYRLAASNDTEIVRGFQEENIAIYGKTLGNDLAHLLIDQGINVSAIIDREPSDNMIVPVYKKEQTPDTITVVVSTLKSDENRQEIKQYYNTYLPEIRIIDVWEWLSDAGCF
jgi:hypothetical protein